MIPAMYLGRLGIVRDQAGKARVVAITTWWIQIALHPLHLAVFEILKGLKQDGTFNQQAPLTLLMSLVPKGQVLYSFDLSAATDRLPIDVQSDILNVLSDGLGTLWRNLLNIP